MRNHDWFSVAIVLIASLFVSSNAEATSKCYQWVLDYDYFHSGWVSSAQGISDTYAAYCNALPYATGIPGGQPGSSCSASCNDTRVTSCVFSSLPVTFYNFPYGNIHVSVVYKRGSSIFTTEIHPSFTAVRNLGCKVYASSTPPAPAQCGYCASGNKIGDPIIPESGSVVASEMDFNSPSDGPEFTRFYDSIASQGARLSSGWRHSYSRRITPVQSESAYRPYTTSPANSSLYTDEAAACTSGFSQIKSQVNNWATATASYENRTCVLRAGSTVIGSVPLYYNSIPTPASGATVLIGYDAVRDDGQVIRFRYSGAAIASPPGSVLRLEQSGSGYKLTDAGDNIEQYGADGRLLSITTRRGVVQTLGYDGANRLTSVTDNFGRSIALTYDGQGRISTVTKQ